MTIDEQRALLIPIAEAATLGRSVPSTQSPMECTREYQFTTGEQPLVLGAFYFMTTVSLSVIILTSLEY